MRCHLCRRKLGAKSRKSGYCRTCRAAGQQRYGRKGTLLLRGDCIEVMRRLPKASVDSIVCDPPYGLEFRGLGWDTPAARDTGFKGLVLPRQRRRNIKCADCGKYIYDHDGRRCECGGVRRSQVSAVQAWHYRWARAALRILKPGGFLLAFGGTRTWHRLACALEDAGFELRDTVCWLYFSGFPKSLNISKAVDKAARGYPQGTNRSDPDNPNAGRYKTQRTEGKRSTADKGQHFGAGPGQFLLKPGDIDPRTGRRVVGVNPNARASGADRGNGWDRPWMADPAAAAKFLTEPATPAAKLWNGFGTALKPAHEPILVAMKPLAGTFVQNAVKHGVAGLNIDGCRIPGASYTNHVRWGGAPRGWSNNYSTGGRTEHSGRWPSNVLFQHHPECRRKTGCHPGCPVHQLDAQAGVRTSGTGAVKRQTAKGYRPNSLGAESRPHGTPMLCYGDSGGASRFFYAAKPSRKERGKFNTHPTVKSLALMRYLVRLTKTPTGGVVLDPFAGSGTTLLAARLEGRPGIGIERDKGYCKIARRRLREQVLTRGRQGYAWPRPSEPARRLKP